MHHAKPEVVVLELDKDRVDLLVDQQQRERPQLWHSPSVELKGPPLPEAEAWPTLAQLRALCSLAAGQPYSLRNIKADEARLLNTGLFGSVRVDVESMGPGQEAQFLMQPDGQLALVAPAGAVQFRYTLRSVPAFREINLRRDSTCGKFSLRPETADALCWKVMAAHEAGRPAMDACLELAAGLQELCDRQSDAPGQFGVLLQGLSSGRIDAVIRPLPPSLAKMPYRSGLETRLLPAPEPAGAASGGRCWRPWTAQERSQAGVAFTTTEEASGAAGRVGTRLMAAHGRIQGQAAAKVGVAAGQAWQVALAEAARYGASQVLLGDLPVSLTNRRAAEGIWGALLSKLIAAGALAAAAAAAAAAHAAAVSPAVPAEAALGLGAAALAAGGAAVWPVAGALLEVQALAGKSAEDIEASVRLTQPVQHHRGLLKLAGEDALLDWPGALEAIIHQRDAYMARTIRAAAAGTPAAPAYVADQVGGQTVWRYVMPDGGPAAACPTGWGEGVYEPRQGPSAVVAVVGSAHVPGIIQEWNKADAQGAKGAADISQQLQAMLQD
ncbi:hypothetical protein WJX72_008889 [[Myrmecia] bisecta]|uniref:Uncharacterized protein n=1 Tax=[Myrmecia] bisecta TaxID=41462 RepID=A0AAW1PD66_9CHLO